jgi:uncharacterized protein YbjT (DUF2867 family)
MAEQTWTVGVTGVTGKTGRAVADRALARGWRVRSLTRRPAPVGDWHHLDWDDERTWGPAMRGCDAVYVIIPFNHPGAAERTPQLLQAAAAAAASRVVLLSSLDAEEAAPEDPLVQAEAALVPLDVDWAVLRPTWFLENFSVGSFAAMTLAGDLRLPAGDGRIPFVAVSDIADVALAALADGGPTGHLPLTGPVSVTHAEVCAALGAALGREIRFTDASPEEFTGLMSARGFSHDYSAFLIEALGNVRSGDLVIPVSDTVERVTGRPATSVADFAASFAASVEASNW